jgi:hypothetical protein
VLISGFFGGKKTSSVFFPPPTTKTPHALICFAYLAMRDDSNEDGCDGCHLSNMAPLVSQITRESIHMLINQPSILAHQRGKPS